MKYYIFAASILLCVSCSSKKESSETAEVAKETSSQVRLITLDPGHFHAALVQKTGYPQVSNDVYVYAPQGDDLQEHLNKIEAYNSREDNPTQWNEIVYAGEDYLQKMLADAKGNVMVTAGNNGKKTAYIHQTLSAGINVLADKPMAIDKENFEVLKECFDIAQQKGVMLYDIMTERYEISTMMQKELSLIPSVYGTQLSGSQKDPAVVKESVHHFFKTVSGKPLKRPMWFFDVEQEGDGIVDVTTHLVDLVQWECFPEQIIDYHKDIEMLDANRWTTAMSAAQFKEVTGSDVFPPYLQKDITNNVLNVYSNGDIHYKIKGIHAKVSVVWNYTFPKGGGDTHYSIMKGSKANLIIRQGAEQGYKPSLYIEAVKGIDLTVYEKDLQEAMVNIADKYPGMKLNKLTSSTWQLEIPANYHVGHEAHFGQVTANFLQYLQEGKLPSWEVPNMLAKYYVTTQALEIAKGKK
ncbi:oxidoreductase [Bacteroidales bacterium]|nr:oxidoreductase [Bacteroidales bacterium]